MIITTYASKREYKTNLVDELGDYIGLDLITHYYNCFKDLKPSTLAGYWRQLLNYIEFWSESECEKSDNPFGDEDILLEYIDSLSVYAEKSQLMYKRCLSAVVTCVYPESNLSIFTKGKRRSRQGRDLTRIPEKREGTVISNVVNFEDDCIDLNEDDKKREDVVKSKSRKSVSATDEMLKAEPEISVLNTGIRQLQVKNTNNKPIVIDFNTLRTECCYEGFEQYLYDKFNIADWAASTKWGYFQQVSRILDYNAIEGKFADPLSHECIISFLRHIEEQTKLGKTGNKAGSLSQVQRNINAILRKFGLRKLAKGQGVDYKSSGNELQSDEYNTKQWIASIRSLHEDRNELLKYYKTGKIPVVHLNSLTVNSFLHTILYTRCTSSELFSMGIPDEKCSYIDSGKGTYVVTGLKSRATKVNDIEPIVKTNGKRFLESWIEISKTINRKFNNDEPLFFPYVDEKTGSITELNGEVITEYRTRLVACSESLKAAVMADSNFSLTPQRLRSSALSRFSHKQGEESAVRAGRHCVRVARQHKYSKGNLKQNQKEATSAAVAIEAFARNGGHIDLAIETTKDVLKIDVLPLDAWQKLHKDDPNVDKTKHGGSCKNKMTKQKSAFVRQVDKNGLLDENDKKHMSCGFLVECFGCDNFGIIDDLEDLWLLLSFRERIQLSMGHHMSLEHFIKNFGDTLIAIDNALKDVTQSKLKLANKILKNRGIHPLWRDEYSLTDIIRG